MFKIRVPATSANLGPGFDSLGVAIDMYNYYSFKEGVSNDNNLVYEAYNKTFEKLNKEIIPVIIEIQDEIPISRGLGSSASCIVGGIMGALTLLELPLDREFILSLGTEIEGHPDNVTPAIFGGLNVSVADEEKIYTNNIPIDEELKFLAIIPDFTLSTALSRSILPKNIPFKDGTNNIGRVSLLLSAFINGRDDLIKIGLKDILHQPYRGKLIEGFDLVMESAYEFGAIGCYLSGAGPTVMCITRGKDKEFIDKIKSFIHIEFPNWKCKLHSVENEGAALIKYL